MPARPINACFWKMVDTDVSWPRQTNASGVVQARRLLQVTIETEADSYSVASLGSWFNNAPGTVTNAYAYVGCSLKMDNGNSSPMYPLMLEGTWNVENIHVSYEGQVATVRMTLWTYTATWNNVGTEA